MIADSGLPALDNVPLDRIGPEDVAAWFDVASSDRPGAANRAFQILRATMFRAGERGMRERDTNRRLGIAKNPRNNVARFLDSDELARLGRWLDAHEARWLEAVVPIRLQAQTGCRRSEVLNLRWHDISDVTIRLRISKTGPRSVPLGEATRAQIEALPGSRCAEMFRLPRHAEGKGIQVLTDCWRTVCANAKLGKLHLHNLCIRLLVKPSPRAKTCPRLGRLLEHRRHRTTAGYAHPSDTHLVGGVEKIGDAIARVMEGLATKSK